MAIKKLNFGVYLNEDGEVVKIDMDCYGGCLDTCPFKNMCDQITATLFKMLKK
jgi:hypothetical protein